MVVMDMEVTKVNIGAEIYLCGNLCCALSLVSGTVEEVKQETKEVIRKTGKGGGLVCMSSNSIYSGVKPENYVAMLEAIKEYGEYPLNNT